MKSIAVRFKITANGWVYEQVCLAECFKLPTTLMANLLIYRVSSRFFIYKFKTNNI